MIFIKEKNPDDYKKLREFFLVQIDSTNNFYILETISEKNKAILVVDKESEQLKDKILATDKNYKFKTYRYHDLISPNALLCHNVDNVLVWCFEDGMELYFTDGMGNETFEDENLKEN